MPLKYLLKASILGKSVIGSQSVLQQQDTEHLTRVVIKPNRSRDFVPVCYEKYDDRIDILGRSVRLESFFIEPLNIRELSECVSLYGDPYSSSLIESAALQGNLNRTARRVYLSPIMKTCGWFSPDSSSQLYFPRESREKVWPQHACLWATDGRIFQVFYMDINDETLFSDQYHRYRRTYGEHPVLDVALYAIENKCRWVPVSQSMYRVFDIARGKSSPYSC
jgi:hypothetical protein